MEELAGQSERLEGKIKETRQDWERKRADDGVPGAVPPEPDPAADATDKQETQSPAPEAPPENAGPGAAETRPEGAVGPPADDAEAEESD